MSCCAVCGMVYRSQSPLCSYCNTQFERRLDSEQVVVRSKPFFIQSLWRWTKKNAKISRLITTNLKGVYDEQRWLPFSSLLLARSQRLPEKSVIIPIPSKRAKQGDHATGFATALSRLTGAAVHECLMPANERRQRGLNRKERLEIRFEIGRAHV